MDANSLLFIGGWAVQQGSNHRAQHMAAYFTRCFPAMDLVAFENFYSGSGPQSASVWAKARKGAATLMSNRRFVTQQGAGRKIVVRDVPLPAPALQRIKEFWRYLLLAPVLRAEYDLAIVGHPENAWLAQRLKNSGRVRRLVYDDWDYFPGLEPDAFASRLVERRERSCMLSADEVISVNSLLAHRRKLQGAKAVHVVPNGVDLRLFARAAQKDPHPPTIVYTGSLSPLWGIEVAVSAMPRILQSVPDARLLIAGAGPAEAALEALSERSDTSGSVKFMGLLAYDALPALLAQSDVGIDLSLPGGFRYFASSMKLVEYMAAGLPVIATRVGNTELTVQQAGAGILIDASVDEFASAAVVLLTDPGKRRDYARAAREYASHFDWNDLLPQAYRYAVGC